MPDLHFENEERRARRSKYIRGGVTLASLVFVAVVLAFVSARSSVLKTNMADTSMGTTVSSGSLVLVNKLAFSISNPKRFDIIVFTPGGLEHRYYYIRRIIGLPGEKLQIAGGNIYIDGEILQEPYEVDRPLIAGLAEDLITLEEDEYFVLGDSRVDSEDSRFANVGFVTRQMILGKALFTLKPKFSILSQVNRIESDQ
jgi:signal peptidase I